MFFSKKVLPEELVGEFITVSDQLGMTTLNTAMSLTGNTTSDDIGYINDNVDSFKVLWPASSCIWGAVYKKGDARRFCQRAEAEIEKNIASHPYGIPMAKQILNDIGDANNKFGKATFEMLKISFPEIDWKKNDAVIPGANFVSSLNYADFLVANNKIAW